MDQIIAVRNSIKVANDTREYLSATKFKTDWTQDEWNDLNLRHYSALVTALTNVRVSGARSGHLTKKQMIEELDKIASTLKMLDDAQSRAALSVASYSKKTKCKTLELACQDADGVDFTHNIMIWV